jgi:hypothetical protein
MTKITLGEFRDSAKLVGNWTVSYNDPAYLLRDESDIWSSHFIELCQLNVCTPPKQPEEPQALHGFRLQPKSTGELEQQFETKLQAAREHYNNPPKFEAGGAAPVAAEKALNALHESLIRTGVAPLQLEPQVLEEMCEKPYIVIICDTNAIRWGISDRIMSVLGGRATLWTIVPVVSMLETQNRAEQIASAYKKPGADKYSDVLEYAPTALSALTGLMALRSRAPVEYLEMPIELLRETAAENYVKDRMIIECVKETLKRRRLLHAYLVSGDVNMLRFAEVEGIDTLLVRKPSWAALYLSPYLDMQLRGLTAVPVHDVLWDLAHVFNTLLLQSEDSSKKLILTFHLEGKTFEDWRLGKLFLIDPDHSGGHHP